MNVQFPQISKVMKIKYAFMAVLFLAIAVFAFSQINGTKGIVLADNCPGTAPRTPAFNIWPLSFTNENCKDLPLIDAKVLNGSGRDGRYAGSQAEHDAGINVRAGDQVRVAIYFHNGASPENQVMATAKDTSIGFTTNALNTPGTTHTLGGSISASNARTVTSNDINTGGNMTLRSASATKLSYVPGTTQMCIKYAHAVERKNAGDSSINLTRTCGTDMQGQPQILVNLPDIAPAGNVVLGDMPACFPYSGVIIFTLAVTASTEPPADPVSSVSVEKWVRNITTGESMFVDQTTGKQGQTVEYKITFKNNGTAPELITVKDFKPLGVQYVAGSISDPTLEEMFSPYGVEKTLAAGQTHTITFKGLLQGMGTQINTVSVDYDRTTVTDTATVVVEFIIEPEPDIVTIDKTVRNITKDANSSFSESTNAIQNDTVEYKVAVKNFNNKQSVQNVLVKDMLPAGSTFIPGTVTLNGKAASDSLVSTGITTSIAPSATATFVYKAKVNVSTGTLVNTASAQKTGMDTVSDTATVIVKPIAPVNTILSISKTVRNSTAGHTAFVDSTTAKQNETVEFKIVVTNTGSVTANNVIVTDSLPQGLSFTGSTNTSLVSGSGQSIGNIAAAQSVTLTFTAKVTATSGTLVNTATAYGANTNTVSDSASVVVSTPPQPTNTTLSLSKTVRNPSANMNNYGESVTAEKDNVVEFRLVVTNTGANTAKNVVLTDALPSGLTLVSGQQAMLTGSGLSLGDISVNSSKTVTFTAKVNVTSGTLVNTGTAVGSNTNTVSDSASVVVKAPPVVTYSLTISKKVRDLTTGQTAYVDSTNVNKNDIVQYQIIVKNTGNGTLTNLKINDNLPSGLTVQEGTFGISVPGNNSTLSNIVVSSLAPGASVTINFSAKVTAECKTITNTASAFADQVATKNDSATINVICAPDPENGTLSITKQVKNISQGGSTFVNQVTANPGDRVAYEIKVKANGGNVNNVTITDTLPSATYFTYATGSAKLNNANFGDSFTTQNVNIGNFTSGQTKTLYFEGTVSNSMPVGQTTLVNTATVSGDNLGTVSDSATVTVNVQGSSGFAQMSINKLVRGNSTGFQESVNAQTNDVVTFQITVTNTGTLTLNNVYVNDILPNGLILRNGSVRLDNSNASDSLIGNRLNIGSLSQGQQRIITFDATVASGSSTTLTNTAQAGADNYSQIQDTASVFVSQVQGTFVNIVQSKRAHNDSKNIDATAVVADRGNIITYTLTVQNTGNAPANNYVIADDLSQVLNYAVMIDPQGGQMNGNVISWPGTTIPAFGTMTKSFRVQVKNDLAPGTYTLVNTFGNTVAINLNSPQVLGTTFVAPKTGPTATYAFGFAALMTLAFAMFRRNGYLKTAMAKIPKIQIR